MDTERLTLRPYRPEDLEDYLAYVSDPEVVRFEPYRPMSRAEAAESLAARMADPAFLALALRDGGPLIGNLYLAPRDCGGRELGYVFRRDCWGRGYAAEACRAALRAAFAEGAHRVFAECDPQNVRSWRLLERLGFTREGAFRQNVWFWTDEAGAPLWKDTYVYALLAAEAEDCLGRSQRA